MGRVAPPPPQPGESARAYQLRLSRWYSTELARGRITLIVIWVAVVLSLFIVLATT